MKYLKSFEGSGFGRSYPGHIEPTPRFNIGDEVEVAYDLTQFGHPYGIVKGDIVTITDFWINALGHIGYKIDSPKLREIKKGIYIKGDTFDEFHFQYIGEEDAKKYNL